MTLEHVIKINDKVMSIHTTPKQENWLVTCPDGHTCHLDITRGKLYHRDLQGRVQVEPTNFNRR